ncbi:MAG: hypothetical protein KDK71_09150, partial [Chlamydiia bacterium]|nr:hypothetical protein [Chlamydiia bacterium]
NWLKVIRKEKLPPDQYSIYKSLTKYAYVNKNTLLRHLGIDLKKGKKSMKVLFEPSAYNFKRLRDHNIICTNKSSIGIPQGAPISSVLSNIYMVDYDLFFQKMSGNLDFIYRRYCDDILFICKHGQADDIIKLAYDKIEECQLTIQPKKEEKIIFTYGLNGKLRGFDKQRMEEDNLSVQALRSTEGEKYYKNLQYLGFEFNGQNVYIRSSSMSRYFQRMKKGTETVVKMAYGPNGKGKKIFKRKLFSRYTHLGKRNFITYALKAASDYYKNSNGEVKRGFNSPTIKKQVSRHFSKLKKIIEQKSKQRAENRGKPFKD